MGGYYTPPPGGGTGGAAGSLETTGAPVVVSTAAPPSNGDVLTATSPTTADWQASGAGGSLLKIATVTLTGAQLAAINSTPVTAIAAQGAGKMIVPVPIISEQFMVGSAYSSYGSLQINLTTHGHLWQNIAGGGDLSLFLSTDAVFSADLPGLAGAPVVSADLSNRSVVVSISTLASGRILASNITAGNAGTGYVAGETFTPNAGNNDAQGVVDTVDGSGAVLTYHIALADAGTLYEILGSVHCEGDLAGTGLEIDITAIQSVSGGDGTLTLTIPYIVVTLQ